MTVDFHVHSNASDGTMSPSELAARSAGFRAMALTDHDNCDGVAEFMGAAAEHGGMRVAGVELSIEAGKGFDKFHLLALGVDIRNEALGAFLSRILEGRNERNVKIVENFRRIGIPMEYGTGRAHEDVLLYAHGDVLARPHFARWLMEHGFSSSVKEAFDSYLAPYSPRETRCYEERYHPSQEETFRIVHGAGGICVMAHPKHWKNEWKSAGPDFASAERELARLKEAGLDGLESMYEANTIEEDIGFTRIANALGLLKSAGSDFHGANKPTISLGMKVPDDFIAPLLERLGDCVGVVGG
ncbi:MAG: PHP domain-containing protein [Lentisphaerae bacterium]|nr:PHP domain-containing protein [Lentisphaerota bacterium]